MKPNKSRNGKMNPVGGSKLSELELHEFGDVKLSIRKRLEPAGKFSDMLCLYRLTDLERSQLKVGIDNPGIIAVIE